MALSADNTTTFTSGDLVTHTKLNTIKTVQTGTTSENNALTGTAGQLTFDTTTNQLRVHNGSQAGGFTLGGSGGAVIADDAVTTAKILDSNVTTGKLADDAVTFAKMQEIANLRAIGNVSGSTANPTEVTINDTDNMSDASATTLATSESIKAYVDAQVSPSSVFASAKTSISGSTLTTNASTGFSSISRSSAGTYVYTFSATQADTNYIVVATRTHTGPAEGDCVVTSQSTSSFTILSSNDNAALQDPNGLNVIVVR